MRLDEAETPAHIARRIAERRGRAGDDHLERFSIDPLGAIEHVRAYPGGVARAVIIQDVADALAIVAALRVELDRHELALIKIGRKQRLSWAELARLLGLKSRQAAEQRKLRLDEAGAGETRSEVAARGRLRGKETEPAWIARHRAEITSLARVVAAGRFLSADAIEDAEELGEALEDPPSPARHLLAVISQVVADVGRAGEVPQLPGHAFDRARRLVSDWDRLRPPA